MTTKTTFDVKEAAEYIGVSRDTVYTMVRMNQIPHIRVRSRILFRRDVLDEYMGGKPATAPIVPSAPALNISVPMLDIDTAIEALEAALAVLKKKQRSARL